MRNAKTQSRVKLETVLQEQTSRSNPKCPRQLAELSGLSLEMVRYYIGKFMPMHLILNAGYRGTSAYYWNAEKPREIAPVESRISKIAYTGERTTHIRETGKAFLLIPSRRGDDLVRYTLPMLMGASLA